MGAWRSEYSGVSASSANSRLSGWGSGRRPKIGEVGSGEERGSVLWFLSRTRGSRYPLMKTSTMRGPGKQYSHILKRSSMGRAVKRGKLVSTTAIVSDLDIGEVIELSLSVHGLYQHFAPNDTLGVPRTATFRIRSPLSHSRNATEAYN